MMILLAVRMAALAIALFLVQIAPPQTEIGLHFRGEVAVAIAAVTDNEHEQHLLASLAWHEGQLDPLVAACVRRGDGGVARSLWQVHPRSDAEARALCGSMEQAATIALARVRESLAVCASNSPETRLAVYTSGRCDRGHAEARVRWVAP